MIFKKDSSTNRIAKRGTKVELDVVVPRSLRRFEGHNDDKSCFITPLYYETL